ncbi:MAG: glutamate racemase [Candidatus Omnitrophica bacterium]|nr:glutamate racemase [Candidatus Omnitrophota bacterium]
MRSLKNRPIGIFDSGVGGLTVARSVRKYLPGENIVYFGDTARVPYGNKSRETILRFSREIMAFLTEKGVKMVIVACNTASSLALSAIKKEYTVPVIGVIEPGVKESLKISTNKRVGVIGTRSTVASGAYKKKLLAEEPSCRVFSRDCPMFVPLVENRFFNDPATLRIAELYLSGIRKRKVDSLILGCTHYPLLKTVIGKVMKGVKLVDSSVAVAKYVKKALEAEDMASSRKRGKTAYFVSDDPGSFCRVARIFLKQKVSARKIIL